MSCRHALAQRVVATYWQTPPPNAPTKAFAQKLSVPPSPPPPSPPPKGQQWAAPGSVQSVLVVQRRTVWVPEHVLPSEVAHAQAAAHPMVIGAVVHLGAVPPVMGILPQHTSDDGQSAADAHEAEPELEPEPEPQPELAPDSPVPAAAASALLWPDPDELELHAPSATRDRKAGTSTQVIRMSFLLTRMETITTMPDPPIALAAGIHAAQVLAPARVAQGARSRRARANRRGSS